MKEYEDLTVLVTGGAGFLGSWLCGSLLKQNAKVICIDNLSSGLLQNIIPFSLEDMYNFTFINHDISTPFYFGTHTHIDHIFHMASRASPLEFTQFPIQILKSNTLGTLNALGISKKYNASLLFTSTSEIYGDTKIIPTPETYNGNVNPVGIRGCYDESKRAGEAFCMAYSRQHNVDVRIVRIFNTYGPLMRADGYYGRVIPRFISQALKGEPITIFGDGLQTRSFCYVSDMIKGLLTFGIKEGLNREVINIGHTKEIEILELARCIRDMTNSPSEIEFHPLPEGDPYRRCPDIMKAKTLLNWHPKVSLEKGLNTMIDYMRINNG